MTLIDIPDATLHG